MKRLALLAIVAGLLVSLAPAGAPAASITYGPQISSDLLLFKSAGGRAWTEYWRYGDARFGGKSDESLAPGWTGYPGEFDGDTRADVLLYQPSAGGWQVRTSTGTGWRVTTGAPF